VRRSGLSATTRNWHEEEGPLYSFFGAAPDTWIGKIWPRGRAWKNDLSTATIADNFCNRWSGGLGFLNHGYSGSEVSIEPDGAVYPCCVKTRLPIGNLLDEPLIEISTRSRRAGLRSDQRRPPGADGHRARLEPETFLAKSRTLTPTGRSYQNACIGCDRFHQECSARSSSGPGCAGTPRAAPRRARCRMSGAKRDLRRRPSLAARLARLGCAALLAIATGATAAPETRSWEAISAAARGQTVYWNAWAGDERTNAFIAWVGDEVRSATASACSRST
jgi:hypothetical protein